MKIFDFIPGLIIFALLATTIYKHVLLNQVSDQIDKNIEQQEILIFKTDSIKKSNTELKEENRRLSLISVMLRSYAPNRSVRKDSLLMDLMIKQTSSE